MPAPARHKMARVRGFFVPQPRHTNTNGPDMTQTAPTDWEGIRITWETTDTPVPEIATAFNLHPLPIHARAKRHNWLPRPSQRAATLIAEREAVGRPDSHIVPSRRPTTDLPAPVPVVIDPVALAAEPSALAAAPPKPRRKTSGPASRGAVQDVIERLWAAIVRRLAILEKQLASSEETNAPDLNPQDAERVDRSMRILMQNLEKVRSLHASNKRPRKPAKSRAESAATLDAQRHALAERIEQLNAQWLARRAADLAEPAGSGPAELRVAPRLVDGGAPGAASPATP